MGGDIPVNEVDRQLFRVCILVQLRSGNTAQFWESSWLEGRAPRDIAPRLYKLAWRKKLKVREQLENQSWVAFVMSSVEEMTKFIVLWDKVQGAGCASQ